jgi:hypothetical protein
VQKRSINRNRMDMGPGVWVTTENPKCTCIGA